MGKSHLLVGAAGFLTVGKPLLEMTSHRPMTAGEIVAGTVVCAGAAMLPDIDHPMATVSRSLGPVTWFLSRATSRVFGGHRMGTHSLPFAAALSLLVTVALRHYPGPVLPLILCFFFTSLCVRVLTEADGFICAAISAGAASTMMMATPHSYGWLAQAIGLGCLLHMLGDVVTTDGIAAMWPLSREHVRFPIVGNAGSIRERWVAGGCGLLTCWLYGTIVVVPALFH
jgi:membrane-bound metal-dependent hydrolase YbcI (DUF457 family)